MSTNPVSDAISSASSVLKNAFGNSNSVEGQEAFRYLDVNVLSEIYKDELLRQDLGEFLSSISSSVNGMRSSYLPLDLLQNLSAGLSISLNEVVADTTSEKESYENAFMRMLGMPDSEEISIGNIKIVNTNGETEEVSFEIVQESVLDERQKPRTERKVVVNNSIYNMEASSFSNSTFNPQEVTGTEDFISEPELLEEQSDTTPPVLSNIENEIYKYSYLLIPPVQDSRFSGCINESAKVVPPNFSNKRGHNINSNNLRTSLLESIIRIRLDRLSGSSQLSTVEVDGQDFEVKSDDYGILESLFIIRLRSALKALAFKVNSDIENLREIYQQTGQIPVARNILNGSLREDMDDRESASYGDTVSGPGEIAAASNANLLEQQRVIEDSMLSLLNDNSEVLDLQTQTQRSSSIQNSHLMGGLLGIIDLPRKRIDQEIKDEEISRKKVLDGPGDKQRENISMAIGTSKGIGAVDIIIFVLALFTMPEGELLGLLDNLEYERFLQEFAGSGDTGGIFGSFGDSAGSQKVETIQAVNTLTDYLLAGYELLKEDIKNDDSGLTLN